MVPFSPFFDQKRLEYLKTPGINCSSDKSGAKGALRFAVMLAVTKPALTE